MNMIGQYDENNINNINEANTELIIEEKIQFDFDNGNVKQEVNIRENEIVRQKGEQENKDDKNMINKLDQYEQTQMIKLQISINNNENQNEDTPQQNIKKQLSSNVSCITHFYPRPTHLFSFPTPKQQLSYSKKLLIARVFSTRGNQITYVREYIDQINSTLKIQFSAFIMMGKTIMIETIKSVEQFLMDKCGYDLIKEVISKEEYKIIDGKLLRFPKYFKDGKQNEGKRISLMQKLKYMTKMIIMAWGLEDVQIKEDQAKIVYEQVKRWVKNDQNYQITWKKREGWVNKEQDKRKQCKSQVYKDQSTNAIIQQQKQQQNYKSIQNCSINNQRIRKNYNDQSHIDIFNFRQHKFFKTKRKKQNDNIVYGLSLKNSQNSSYIHDKGSENNGLQTINISKKKNYKKQQKVQYNGVNSNIKQNVNNSKNIQQVNKNININENNNNDKTKKNIQFEKKMNSLLKLIIQRKKNQNKQKKKK